MFGGFCKQLIASRFALGVNNSVPTTFRQNSAGVKALYGFTTSSRDFMNSLNVNGIISVHLLESATVILETEEWERNEPESLRGRYHIRVE